MVDGGSVSRALKAHRSGTERALRFPRSPHRGGERAGFLSIHRDPIHTPEALAVETVPTAGGARDRFKLSLLIQISKELTHIKDVELLLGKLAEYTFRLIDVDQAAVLLFEDGALRVRHKRVRPGTEPHPVPVSLAQSALDERMALLSDDTADSTDGSALRSTLCAPLISGDEPLGVLYVDSLASTHRVDDDDLEFLVAFAGIGAVALENLRFAERSRQDALIRGNFERFFAPHLAARIAASPDALRLGGERRRVAVLFSDIRGFTPLAARLTPDATAKLLTEYFSEMAECVFKHGGTLDKFIGDAVMAQWGAPLSEADDADRALEAAVDMMQAVAKLNARWQREGRPMLQVGIGLNYGDVFAGYLGSERRLEYTIIGDVVNTANRLCEAAAGGTILVGQPLKDACTRQQIFTQAPSIKLAGRVAPVSAFYASCSPRARSTTRIDRLRDYAAAPIASLTRHRPGLPVLHAV